MKASHRTNPSPRRGEAGRGAQFGTNRSSINGTPTPALPRRGREKRRRSHRNGLIAEWVALVYFLLKAYRPLAWRYKTPVGEIDLILTRGRRLVFVEVKARAKHDLAAEAVHGKNQARVVRAAQYFLAAHPQFANREVRFDVCLIAWYRWPKHLADAFS